MKNASHSIPGAIKLPLRFDPDALHRDLDRVPDESWIPHFNQGDYEGDWSAVALRGPAGATHPILELSANPGTRDWANTGLCDRCPYFAEAMSAFECELMSVRLLRLAPGAVIKEHVDHSLAFEDGEVRLHVPVKTNENIRFWLNGERVRMDVGETWYLNVNLPHRVENPGAGYRVHLVLDCVVNDWLRAQAGIAG